MTGIYCWTNKQNGKKYIGQSVNIERRRIQHIAGAGKYSTKFSRALEKYGLNNFSFEILEETTIELLNEKETYYIKKLNSHHLDGHGYNMNYGGDQENLGQDNPNAKLTDNEVLEIRNRIFIENEIPKEVYKDFEDKISYSRFWSAFHGDTFKNVDTSMIRNLEKITHGSFNGRSKLNEADVLDIRTRIHIKKETPLEVFDDYKEIISFATFMKAYRGETWTKVDTSMIGPVIAERKGKPKAKITKEQVAQIRYDYENNIKTLQELYQEYHFVTNSTIKRIVNYETWKDIKPVSTISEA